MTALTRVEAGPMFGVPQRPRLRLAAPRPVDLDQDDLPAGHEDRGFSNEALANLANELQHSTAQVNSLIQADVLPKSPQDPVDDPITALATQRHQAAMADINATVARSLEEGEQLRDAAMRLTDAYEEKQARLNAAYQEAMAPIVEALNEHARREAHLRRDLDRRFVRLQPKRSSRKRA